MKRLIEELPPGFEASLLRSEAEKPGPSAEARSRALDAAVQAMAAAGGTVLIAGKAAAATVSGSAPGTAGAGALTAATVTAPLVSKAWVISLLVGATAVGTAAVVVHERTSETRPASSALVEVPHENSLPAVPIEPIRKDELPPEPAVTPNEAVAPTPPMRVTPRPGSAIVKRSDERGPLVSPSTSSSIVAPKSPAADPSDQLAEEIALIDGARAALVAHHPDEAIRALDEYDRRFGRASLAREAALLRVEALSARGDRSEAIRLAEQLLAKNPDAPYRARLRKVLGQSQEP